VTRDLRILHVFPGFKIGGAQMRLVELAKGFGESFAHTIIALDGHYTAAQLFSPGIRVTLGGMPNKSGSLPQRLARIRRAIADHAPDLLITYNWGSIEWAMANAIGGVPHIHIEDGFGPEEAVHQFRRRVWTRRLTLRNSQLIVPSNLLQDIALGVWRLSSARVHYIPNGITPLDSYSTRIDELGLNLPRELPRIAWAGALRREKNLIRLLRAFAPLKNQAVLLVIGDGPELDAVLREAEELCLGPSIRFLGRREDVRDILMQCDLMALSSDTEQMPLAVLEAMDAGLAVASTNVGDVRHMISAENQPYIVNGSDRELGAAMRALVMGTAARKAAGTANKRRLRQNYLADDMVAAHKKLMLETANARK
jgi:glycosyltransferase involved in cell wall biosynthesis